MPVTLMADNGKVVDYQDLVQKLTLTMENKEIV